MQRPSIIFINRVYPPYRGATGRVLKDLTQEFVRRGWHVSVLTTGAKSGKSLENGVQVIRIKGPEDPQSLFSYLLIWLRLCLKAMVIKKRHLMITMSDPPLLVVAGTLVAKIRGMRHMNWCHDLYPEVLPALGKEVPEKIADPMKKLRTWAMSRCDKVVVIGRCMAKYLAQQKLDARKIAMIPNWPDLELTDPEMLALRGKPYKVLDPKVARPFDDQIKSVDRFRILYSGNLGLAHPYEMILDAAQILQDEGSDIEIVFVGSGQRFDLLSKERARRHLDNVRLLPYQPAENLRKTLESGYVHLITMRDEAAGCLVPSKLYAALAVARPSIFVGPSVCEASKVIKDFKAGSIVKPGDVKGLVKVMKDYRESQDVWVSAQSGAAKAREVFTPQDSLAAWLERAMVVVEQDLKKTA